MTRVLKLGGRAQNDPRLASAIAAAWAAQPGALCLVHGGGDEISALQHALGVEPAFAGGRRVTSARDLDIVRMALSGTANKRLVAQLVAAGVPAVGLSGEDGALIEARLADDATLGYVGTPQRINVPLLRHLLAGGYLPVISPLACDATARSGDARTNDTRVARALNVNGDDAAAAIATALGAAELLLVADVPGVLVAGRPVPMLDPEEAMAAIANGVARGGMAAKLQAGISALQQGVERVRIGDLDAIFDPARGTTLAPARSLV